MSGIMWPYTKHAQESRITVDRTKIVQLYTHAEELGGQTVTVAG